MTYPEACAYIWGLTDYERRTGYDYSAERFDLSRVRHLLRLLGDPQAGMLLAHVGGTKGKGSTSAMLASILGRSGERVGLYTSPHLHTIRERVQIGGAPVGREAFAAAVERVAAATASVPGITTFEALTAAGFAAFADAGVRTAVIEVGLGGRLDATNVIEPYVTVLTSISYDHTAILGETLTAIAGEKAGIIKPGVPVLSAAQADEAGAVIAERAAALGSGLEVCGRDWQYGLGEVSEAHQGFSLQGRPRQRAIADGEYVLPLLGRHQVENAALALAAAEHAPAGLGLEHGHLIEGLASVHWPGRFEVVRTNPWVVLDGAHNDDSMRKLVEALQRHAPHRRLHVIFGASRDKHLASMLGVLSGPGVRLYACRSPHPRSAPAEDVVAAAGLPGRAYASVDEALFQALAEARHDDCVCVTGSLFVVAAAREAIARRSGSVDSIDIETEVLSLGDSWRI